MKRDGSHRDAVMRDVRAALEDRDRAAHPGAFGSWGLAPGRGAATSSSVTLFIEMLGRAGGDVVQLDTPASAASWMEAFAQQYASAAVGNGVPSVLRPSRPAGPPEDAPLGVSLARYGVAETGSLILDARDGRRVQLLPPVHLVWLPVSDLRATHAEVLAALRAELPSAFGIHSGPSKSADIGQILVTGVHGPGRLVVGLIGFDP